MVGPPSKGREGLGDQRGRFPRKSARTVRPRKGSSGVTHGEYWHGQPRCCRYREVKAPATDEEGLNRSISPPPVQTSRTEATGTVIAAASMRWIRISSMITFCLIWKIS
jgi:hypothetical protein